MDGPGWTLRSSSGVVVGTTSLSFSNPSASVNDVLVLAFSHKGTAFATLPAGWTLIQQGLSTAIRGELYWRRVSGTETWPLLVTGLATSAQGVLVVYTGGLLSGDLVDASSLYVWTGTGIVTPGFVGDVRATSITPSVEQTLLVSVVVSDNQESSFNPMRLGTHDKGPPDGKDDSTYQMVPRAEAHSTTRGTFLLAEIIKVPAVATGDLRPNTTSALPAGAHALGILAALKPEPTSPIVSGTRYYLSTKITRQKMTGTLHGQWGTGLWSGVDDDWAVRRWTWLLSKSKTDAGGVGFSHNQMSRNAPPGVVNPVEDVLFARWMTPPLAAQTIDGTLDLTLAGQVFQASSSTPPTTGVLKVHAYITVGQSTSVRATLLDRFVDTRVFDQLFHTLGLGPQTLTAAACLDGDSIIVEIGARLTAAGTYPALPSVPFANVRWSAGATTTEAVQMNSAFNCAGVGVLDAAPGNGVSPDRAAHLDFSHTVVEQAPSGSIPANSTSSTAVPITTLPYTATLDASRVPSGNRRLWFVWTADVTGQVFAHGLFNHSVVTVSVYKSATAPVPSGAVPPFPELLELRSRTYTDTLSSAIVAATAGTTYYFAIETRPNLGDGTGLFFGSGWAAPASAGLVTFSLQRYIPPADGDVIVASSSFLARYTSQGVLADLSGGIFAPVTGLASGSFLKCLGLALDYTRRPLVDQSDGVTPDASVRLLVAVYNNPSVYLVPVANFGRGRAKTGGGTISTPYVDIISNPWFYNGSSASNPHPGQLPMTLAQTDAGLLVVSHAGSGYDFVGNQSRTSGSSTFATTYQIDPATSNTAALLLVDSSHGDHQPGFTYPTPTTRLTQIPAVSEAGTNNIALAADNRTLFYTSSGWYVPLGTQTIKRWDIVSGTQLADFATLPVGPGPNPGVKGIAPLREGGCLACNGAEVVLLDPAGTVLRHYAPSGATVLFDVRPGSAEDVFWAIDGHTATLYKFNLATGALLLTVPTGLGGDELRSLVIYDGIGYEACPCVEDAWSLGVPTPALTPVPFPTTDCWGDDWTFSP